MHIAVYFVIRDTHVQRTYFSFLYICFESDQLKQHKLTIVKK
jgi:hypothetical protein